MYVHVEHYLNDVDLSAWLSNLSFTMEDAYEDPALLNEYIEEVGSVGEVVKIL